MKLKKLFALALAVCMMALAVPAAFAASLTLDYGTTTTTPVVEEQPLDTPVTYDVMQVNEVAIPLDASASTITANTAPEATYVYKTDANGNLTTQLESSASKTATVSGSTINLNMQAEAVSNIVDEGAACNIVLVLDASNGMVDNKDVLHSAVTTFLNDVAATSPTSKVAIVSYATEGAQVTGGNVRADALRPIVVNNQVNPELTAAANTVRDRTGTDVGEEYTYWLPIVGNQTEIRYGRYSNKGLRVAAEILQTTPDTENAPQPVVILFTNKIPTTNVSGSFDWLNGAYDIAKESISWGEILKNTKGVSTTLNTDDFYSSSFDVSNITNRIGCGAKVYCVGVNLPDGDTEAGWSGTDGDKVNEFLYRLSSHRPNGSHVGDGSSREINPLNPWESEITRWTYNYQDNYTRNRTDTEGYSYYLTGQMSGLSTLFGKIQVQLASSIAELTATDYIPDYLKLNTENLTTGKDTNGSYAQWKDFELNPGNAQGEGIKRFNETINVSFVDGFIGGSNIPTNGPNSGIYKKNEKTAYLTFPIPTVDHTLAYSSTAVPATIYLSKPADLDSVFVEGTVDGVTNAFVNITFTVTEKETGDQIATETVSAGGTLDNNWIPDVYPTSCTTYVLSWVIDDVNSAATLTGSVEGIVHVLQPVITSTEQTVYLSKRAELNAAVTGWQCTCQESPKTAAYIDGDPLPESYVYKFTDTSKGTNTFEKDTPGDCTEYQAIATMSGKTFEGNVFTVHVLKPTVYTEGTTIYLGKTASLIGKVGDNWSCAAPCTAGKTKTTTEDAAPQRTDFTWDFVKNTDTTDSIVDEKLTGCTDVYAVGTLNGQSFTSEAAVTVHVVRPVITSENIAMYYGNSLNMYWAISDQSDWTCGDKSLKADGAPDIDYEYSVGTDGVVDAYEVDACMNVTVSAEVEGFPVKVDGKNESKFRLHVMKPVVTFKDSAIYLSGRPNYATENYVSADWTDCKNESIENVKKVGTDPSLSYDYTPDDRTFSRCTDVDVTVKINDDAVADTHVTFGIEGTSTKAEGKEFTVHVVKPVIEYHDKTIYLGDTVTVADQVTEGAAWLCGHNASLDVKSVAGERIAPVVEYEYGSTDTAPDDCALITVTAKIKDTAIAVPAKNEDTGFDIHILKPKFTVVADDRWADYDQINELTLTDYVVTTTKEKTEWADTHTDHTNIPAVDANVEPNAPSDFTYTIQNEQKETVSTYLVGVNDADFTVVLNGFKIGDTTYDANNWAGVIYDGNNKNIEATFTIHVNKFDLTISKSWKDGNKDADRIYKQDAIFNLYHVVGDAETGDLITQVVLPASQENIKITGLLCGQNYKVEEQTNWTWRWKANVDADGEEQVFVDVVDCGSHTVNTSNPHDATEGKTNPTAHGEKTVTFINSLFNRLWFSFCTFVENVFAALTSQEGGNF